MNFVFFSPIYAVEICCVQSSELHFTQTYIRQFPIVYPESISVYLHGQETFLQILQPPTAHGRMSHKRSCVAYYGK